MKRKMFVLIGVLSIVATSGLGALTSYATGEMVTATNQKTGASLAVYKPDVVKEMGDWESIDGDWKFKLKDGNYLVNSWIASIEIEGGYYYVDSTGVMLANTTMPDGYALGENGLWTNSSTVSQEEIDAMVQSKIEENNQPVESNNIDELQDKYKADAESMRNNPEYQKLFN
jgi:hypothetical protein